MLLRPYQATGLADIRNAYRRGYRRVVYTLPTGGGKSAMTEYMLGTTGMSTLILAHRIELVEMIAERLPVSFGLVTAGSKPSRERVQVGMVQTVTKRLADLPKFQWVISDECHLAMSASWSRILSHYGDAYQLGLSATPCRLDGIGLGTIYQQIVHGPSIRELIDGGYLVPPRVFAPAAIVERLHMRGGEFAMDEAADLLNTTKITGDAAAQLRKHGPNEQAVAFCCTVQHAQDVASHLSAAGIPAGYVDGSMPSQQRRGILDAFYAKRLQVLCNVDILTTGWDYPALGALIFLRPTSSLALYLQMVGRVLRISPGKRAGLILDHVGNTIRHGMPDARREWTLEGKAKSDKPPPVSTCPMCFAAFAPAPRCPQCGHDMRPAEAASGRQARQTDGELVEIDRASMSALAVAPVKELLRLARTEMDLRRIARAKGYQSKWVLHVMKHSRGKFDPKPAAPQS